MLMLAVIHFKKKVGITKNNLIELFKSKFLEHIKSR